MSKILRRTCHICGRFRPKDGCKNEHNMEKYEQRMIDQGEADDAERWEYEIEQAGGLDAVQEREREQYNLAKYGEY